MKLKTLILILTLLGLNIIVWGCLGYINLSHPFVIEIKTIPAQLLGVLNG